MNLQTDSVDAIREKHGGASNALLELGYALIPACLSAFSEVTEREGLNAMPTLALNRQFSSET